MEQYPVQIDAYRRAVEHITGERHIAGKLLRPGGRPREVHVR